IRLRLRLSSIGFGLVSLLTVSSIFPSILGPSIFEALIFVITTGSSFASPGVIVSLEETITASGFTAVFCFAFISFGGVSFFVPLPALFLGLVEESMALR